MRPRSRSKQYMKETKNLNANVDFYSASTYYSLGIPIDLFTPIFAVSRMSGWTAHVLEQYHNNRLIRPRADYIGDCRSARRGSRSPSGRQAESAARRVLAMYDLSFFRNNLDAIAKRLADRGFTLDVEAFPQARRRAARGAHRIRTAEGPAERRIAGNRQAAARPGRTRRNASRKSARWASASRRSINRPTALDDEVPPDDGGRSQHCRTNPCPPARARTTTSKCAAGARRPSSLSRPKRIGIWGRNWEFWISNGRRRSPARASPCTGAWARSWSGR